MKTPNAVPLYSAPADQGPAPHAYVVYTHKQLCSCGCSTTWVEVFAKTWFRRSGSAPVLNHRRVTSPSEIKYNLPIQVEQRPDENVPFCASCAATATLSHLPVPPQPATAVPPPSWISKGLEAATKPTKVGKTYTVDDLL